MSGVLGFFADLWRRFVAWLRSHTMEPPPTTGDEPTEEGDIDTEPIPEEPEPEFDP